jgi:hypothetical protein
MVAKMSLQYSTTNITTNEELEVIITSISDDDFAVDLAGELVIIWDRFTNEQRSFKALLSDVTYIISCFTCSNLQQAH